MKKTYSSKCFLRVLFSAVLSLTLVANSVYASDDITFTVERHTYPIEGEIIAGAPFEMIYTIQPQPVVAKQIATSEVVLVIDTSGSMSGSASGGGSRIQAAKAAATNFVTYFSSKPNLKDKVKISIVDYSEKARVKKSLVYSDDASLLTTISALPTTGYTNIGDGIRRGFYELDAGSTNAKKIMIFMTDGYANRRSYYETGRKRKKIRNYLYDNRVSYSTDSRNAIYYAQQMVEKLKIDSDINSEAMAIQSYFIAFSNNASSLATIVKDTDGSMRLPTSEFIEVGTASSLDAYYQTIAADIESAIALDLKFKESFIGNIVIGDVLADDVSGITNDEIVIQSIAGHEVVESDTDGWSVDYTLNADRTQYTAEPINIVLRITPNDAGEFSYGKAGSSFFEFNVPGSETGEIATILLDEQSFTAKRVNAPQINMSQDEDSDIRTFTLGYTGLANMHFGGQEEKDYITFDHAWSDALFNKNQDEWTIRAVIEPETLNNSESTNHNIENVFISKASNSKNDNLEIGINQAGHLEIYLDTKGKDGMVEFSEYVIETGKQHDIIVSFDKGRLTATIDGFEYTKSDYDGFKMDQAVGSNFTLGASLHVKSYFDGKMNQVSVYNKAFSAEDIAKGVPTSSDTEVSWHAVNALEASGSVSAVLKDSSGNGRDSTDVTDTFIQNDMNPAYVTMFYKIDVLEGSASDVGWKVYTKDAVITALNQSGVAKVSAKAVYDDPDDGYDPISSQVVHKTATLAEGEYIKRILMSSKDSVVTVGNPSDEFIEEDEYITVTYTFEGNPFTMMGETASLVTINPVTLTVTYPDDTLPEVPTGFAYDAGADEFTMTKTDVKVKKITSGADSGKYQLESFHVDIKMDPTSYKNFVLASGSATAEYTDGFNHDRSTTNTNSIPITVLPDKPIIREIGSGNVVFQSAISSAEITGTATLSDMDNKIYMKVSGDNLAGTPEAVGGYGEIVYDSSINDYSYTVEGLDLIVFAMSSSVTLLDPGYKAITATAKVVDPEGDENVANKDFIIFLSNLNLDIK